MLAGSGIRAPLIASWLLNAGGTYLWIVPGCQPPRILDGIFALFSEQPTLCPHQVAPRTEILIFQLSSGTICFSLTLKLRPPGITG
jgi:hypothetical protein